MSLNPSAMKYCGEQITDTVVCHRPGRLYSVSGHQDIEFIHMNDGVLRTGTTNEELLTVLIHRIRQLDEEVPCIENKVVLHRLIDAHAALVSRSTRVQANAAKPLEVATFDPSQDPHCLCIG